MYILLCVASGYAILAPGTMPPPVDKALSQRQSARTSRVEYVIQHRDLEAPLSEHFVTQTAGASVIQTNFGDANGEHPRKYAEVQRWLADFADPHQTVEMHDYKFAQPHRTLLYDDLVWHKMGTGLSATARPPSKRTTEPIFDSLASGAFPRPSQRFRNPLDVPRAPASIWDGASYDVKESGQFKTITSDVEYHGRSYRMEWDIDPARGEQPVRSTLYLNGEMQFESLTKLEKIGDRWIPKRTQFFRHDFASGTEPYQVVDVTDASFNQPWHSQEPFTPTDIGIALGHQLGVEGSSTTMYWDGAELLTETEYNKLVYLDGVDPDPVVVARQAKWMKITNEEYLEKVERSRPIMRARWEKENGPYVDLIKADGKEDAWDRYAAEFIKTNKLDAKRRDKAMEILEKSKKIRDFHARKNQAKIRKAEKENDERKLKAYESIKTRIFERVLVRGLQKLLPRTKRSSSG